MTRFHWSYERLTFPDGLAIVKEARMHERTHRKVCLFGDGGYHGIGLILGFSHTQPELISVIGVFIMHVKIKQRLNIDRSIISLRFDSHPDRSGIGFCHAAEALEMKRELSS